MGGWRSRADRKASGSGSPWSLDSYTGFQPRQRTPLEQILISAAGQEFSSCCWASLSLAFMPQAEVCSRGLTIDFRISFRFWAANWGRIHLRIWSLVLDI